MSLSTFDSVSVQSSDRIDSVNRNREHQLFQDASFTETGGSSIWSQSVRPYYRLQTSLYSLMIDQYKTTKVLKVIVGVTLFDIILAIASHRIPIPKVCVKRA